MDFLFSNSEDVECSPPASKLLNSIISILFPPVVSETEILASLFCRRQCSSFNFSKLKCCGSSPQKFIFINGGVRPYAHSVSFGVECSSAHSKRITCPTYEALTKTDLVIANNSSFNNSNVSYAKMCRIKIEPVF